MIIIKLTQCQRPQSSSPSVYDLKFPDMVFKPVELNIVDRVLIYAMIHKLPSVENDISVFLA